jgi:hypothetical protein
MIPKALVTKDYVLAALGEIDVNGVPENRGAKGYVKATGANKETLESTGPAVGPVWVHKFTHSDVPARLKALGFKRMSFVNSITFEIWSQKIE